MRVAVFFFRGKTPSAIWIGTPGSGAAELRFGISKKRSLQLEKRIEEALQALEVAPFEAPADVTYAAIRAGLERNGTPIGGNDLFIAAHALALGFTLVTANMREFARADGLKCENWLAE